MTDGRRLSEEDARRLWRRAAELQTEAARRLEAAAGEGVGGQAGEEESGDPGYALEDVREAAAQAGIDRAFVDRALAELDAAGTVVDAGRAGALAERFLGHPPDVLVVSHVFEASAERVYEALRTVLPRPPFDLEVVETRGHPLEGGSLVLEVPSIWTHPTPGTLAYEVRGWADIKEIHLTLGHPDGTGERCEVSLVCPLGRSKRINFWTWAALDAFVSLMVGMAGAGALAVAASTFLFGAITPVLAVAWVVLGTPALLYAGMHGSRAIYAYALQRGRKALLRLLDAVALQAGVEGALGLAGFPGLPGGGSETRATGS